MFGDLIVPLFMLSSVSLTMFVITKRALCGVSQVVVLQVLIQSRTQTALLGLAKMRGTLRNGIMYVVYL